MPISESLAFERSHSRDWSIPRTNGGEPGEGHRAIRFPIKLPVRYEDGGEFGSGEIVNIGSRVALFTTDRALALDACVELYVKWPVLLDNSVQLSLIASGPVIRVEPGRAEMAIGRYEFRTCALSFLEHSHPGQLAVRGASAQKSPRESRMVNLQKGDRDDARWERVFQERFADTRILQFETLNWLGPLS
jgi:hypothetical protein